MYNVKLDEKYRVRVVEGNVELLRYEEPWLTNPPGAKAWISAADAIETLENNGNLSPQSGDEYSELTDIIDKVLTDSWGRFTRDKDIADVSRALSRSLDTICAGTNVTPKELIEALTGLTPPAQS